MKKNFGALILVVLFLATCAMTACKPSETEPPAPTTPNTITNAGFETGDLTGWTLTGSAFRASGVVTDDYVESTTVGKKGNNLFNGLAVGMQAFTGTMKSTVFKIEGLGYVAFLLGAGRDPEKCYVTIKEEGTNAVLATQGNDVHDGEFIDNEMVRYVVDVSEHIGKKAYIEVVDNDEDENEEGLAYLLLDDFITYVANEAALDALDAEREERLDELVWEFSETETNTFINNPGFEQGFRGWKVLDESGAFTKKAVIRATDKWWGDRDYHGVGNRILDGYINGEAAIGAMRSSKFTINGNYISFLFGGAHKDPVATASNIALFDAETDTQFTGAAYKVTNTGFTDSTIGRNMTRYYINTSELQGKVAYIKISDTKDGGWGAITCDDFRVNLSDDETKALMVETYNTVMALPSDTGFGRNDRGTRAVKAWYNTDRFTTNKAKDPFPMLRITVPATGKAIFQNPSVNLNDYINSTTVTAAKNGFTAPTGFTYAVESVSFNGGTPVTTGLGAFDMSAAGLYTVKYYVELEGQKLYQTLRIDVAKTGTIRNAGFEAGSLDGWTVTSTETQAGRQLSSANNKNIAIRDDYAFWGENVPFNKSGDYFFMGGVESMGENVTGKMRSDAFILGGSGYISFKMAGNGARVNIFVDGVKVAVYEDNQFNDVPGNVYVSSGSRLATMATYVADLSAYIGKEVEIELEKFYAASTVPWRVCMFDDIVINYDAVPDYLTKYDLVNQINLDAKRFDLDVKLPWILAQNII